MTNWVAGLRESVDRLQNCSRDFLRAARTAPGDASPADLGQAWRSAVQPHETVLDAARRLQANLEGQALQFDEDATMALQQMRAGIADRLRGDSTAQSQARLICLDDFRGLLTLEHPTATSGGPLFAGGELGRLPTGHWLLTHFQGRATRGAIVVFCQYPLDHLGRRLTPVLVTLEECEHWTSAFREFQDQRDREAREFQELTDRQRMAELQSDPLYQMHELEQRLGSRIAELESALANRDAQTGEN